MSSGDLRFLKWVLEPGAHVNRANRYGRTGIMLGELRFISRSFYKVEVRIYGGDSFYIFSNFTRAHSASAAGHRPEYSSLDLSNIWPRFSSEVLFTFTTNLHWYSADRGRVVRRYSTTDFHAGSYQFSIQKIYRSELHRAEDWPTLGRYHQLKHSLLQQLVQATNFLFPPSHPQVC